MKTLNIVGFVVFIVVFTLGTSERSTAIDLKGIIASLLQTSYLKQEEQLSHIQLLAVKIGSTVSLIMLIIWVLWHEFKYLFLS